MEHDIIQGEINACKLILAQTDYKLLKYLDGELPEADYAPVRELRNQMRRRINELETT